MPTKYVDSSSIIQVIGCVFTNPSLLDYTDKYDVVEDDFPELFHKIVYGAIYKLHELGSTEISLENIQDYLADRPKYLSIYEKERGADWLLNAGQTSNINAFDYYYSRLKKMTLLRAYDNCGLDIKDIYDPDNIMDLKKRQAQEDYIDNSSLETLADRIEAKIEAIRIKYVGNLENETLQAGEGIFDLITSLEENPEVGVPLYGNLINTVTRGARLGKFYIRSAGTGVGKTRSLIADACHIACNKVYNPDFGWIPNGVGEPVLFIATEQDLSEVQTMMLAFLANVNEDHILYGKYEKDERERVMEAAKIISNSPLYVETIPDFSLRDIEDCIKKNIRDNEIKYCFFDYIRSSMKILEEVTRRSGGVKLREDNILFMLSLKLKAICTTYDVFIETATQLSGDFAGAETPDQNLLRGAKSIADACDFGSILLAVSEKDIECLQPILEGNSFAKPMIKLSIYKNRRGRYKGLYLWCEADLGTCKINPIFATTYTYEFIEMSNLKIETYKKRRGAF